MKLKFASALLTAQLVDNWFKWRKFINIQVSIVTTIMTTHYCVGKKKYRLMTPRKLCHWPRKMKLLRMELPAGLPAGAIQETRCLIGICYVRYGFQLGIRPSAWKLIRIFIGYRHVCFALDMKRVAKPVRYWRSDVLFFCDINYLLFYEQHAALIAAVPWSATVNWLVFHLGLKTAHSRINLMCLWAFPLFEIGLKKLQESKFLTFFYLWLVWREK